MEACIAGGPALQSNAPKRQPAHARPTGPGGPAPDRARSVQAQRQRDDEPSAREIWARRVLGMHGLHLCAMEREGDRRSPARENERVAPESDRKHSYIV